MNKLQNHDTQKMWALANSRVIFNPILKQKEALEPEALVNGTKHVTRQRQKWAIFAHLDIKDFKHGLDTNKQKC